MKSVLFCFAVFFTSASFAQESRIEDTVIPKVTISEGNTTAVIYLDKKEDNPDKIQTLRTLVKHAIRYCEPKGCENDISNLTLRIESRAKALHYKVKKVEVKTSQK